VPGSPRFAAPACSAPTQPTTARARFSSHPDRGKARGARSGLCVACPGPTAPALEQHRPGRLGAGPAHARRPRCRAGGGHHRPVGPRVIDRPGYAGAFHSRRRLPPDRLTRQQLASSLRRDFPSREGARGCRQLALRGTNASWWSGASSSTASRTHSSGSKGGDGVGGQQCPPCPPLPCPESGQRDHAEGQANGDVQRTNQARQRG
jgi:hypothetical protein